MPFHARRTEEINQVYESNRTLRFCGLYSDVRTIAELRYFHSQYHRELQSPKNWREWAWWLR